MIGDAIEAPRTLTATTVTALPGRSSESPFWDAKGGRLIWVETTAGAVHTWSPRTGSTTSQHLDGDVGCVVPCASGDLLVALDARVVVLQASGQVDLLVEFDNPEGRLRLNDGGCAPDGAFWVGSMARDLSPGKGALYRVVPTGEAREVLRDVGISNGLGWSPDGERMYYIDSLAGGLDVLEGPIGELRRARLLDIPDDRTSPIGTTVPDGMTVDAEGHLWVAVFGAGEVRRYSPGGVLELVIRTPHPAPTSCAFGGREMRDLFITSGAEASEHVFHCRPGVRGLPAADFAA